jgi:hypothetical protein
MPIFRTLRSMRGSPRQRWTPRRGQSLRVIGWYKSSHALFIFVLLLLSDAHIVFAQRRNVPEQGKIVLHFNKQGQAYSLTGLYSSSEDNSGCAGPATWIGTIVHIRYDDITATRTLGITVEDSKRERNYLNIREDLYKKLSMVELGHLSSIFKKRKLVRVKSYGCGAAGRVEMLDAITLLRYSH